MTWQEHAACAGLAPDFDITGGTRPTTNLRTAEYIMRLEDEKRQASVMLAVCEACPVRRECLVDAVDTEMRESHGGGAATYASVFVAAQTIRGGLTGNERAMHYAELIEDDSPAWRGLRAAARIWLKGLRDPVLTRLLQEKQK